MGIIDFQTLFFTVTNFVVPVAIAMAMTIVMISLTFFTNRQIAEYLKRAFASGGSVTLHDDDAPHEPSSPPKISSSSLRLPEHVYSSSYQFRTTTITTPFSTTTITNAKKDNLDEELRVEQARKKEEEERKIRVAKLTAECDRRQAELLKEQEQLDKIEEIISKLELPKDIKVIVNPEAVKALAQQIAKVPLSPIVDLVMAINEIYPSTVLSIADSDMH